MREGRLKTGEQTAAALDRAWDRHRAPTERRPYWGCEAQEPPLGGEKGGHCPGHTENQLEYWLS